MIVFNGIHTLVTLKGWTKVSEKTSALLLRIHLSLMSASGEVFTDHSAQQAAIQSTNPHLDPKCSKRQVLKTVSETLAPELQKVIPNCWNYVMQDLKAAY